MRTRARVGLPTIRASLLVAAAVMHFAPQPALASSFVEDLERVDRALEENPSKLSQETLQACKVRRNDAARLYNAGHVERAERRIKHCMRSLGIAEPEEEGPAAVVKKQATPSIDEIQARAAREIERALELEANVANGLEIYRTCAECHTPEGWGLASALIPQLAGQHRRVVIKQLADIRAGNRGSVVMAPYATLELIGGAQSIADVAGYIDTLEMSVDNGKGAGDDLELGARLYRENCARCHGQSGEGDPATYAPRIQAQHYGYLVGQFESIRDGRRRNANPEMVAQIRDFDDRRIRAVLDYVSRLEPPEDLRAPPGWHNPDFAR